MERLVSDRLTRYLEGQTTESMVLYLIHRDLQALVHSSRAQHADDVRRREGF